MLNLWGTFFVSATAVVLAGIFVSRVSGEMADRFKLGRAWAGSVLIAIATSLPELGAVLTVSLRGQVEMGLGGILGSIIFNLAILFFVDLSTPRPIYKQVAKDHLFTSLLGIVLLGLLVVGLMVENAGLGGGSGVGLGHVGLFGLLMCAAYGAGQFVSLQQARHSFADQDETEKTGLELWDTSWVVLAYIGLSVLILYAAYRLALSAEGLASHYGLGATFAGATLLGIVTSLPELASAYDCRKRQDYDSIFGNVLGSNTFVFFVFVLVEFATLGTQLLYTLRALNLSPLVTMAGIAIIMQALVGCAIALKSSFEFKRIGLVSVLLLLLYLASLLLSYRFGS